VKPPAGSPEMNKYQWCLILGLVLVLVVSAAGCKNLQYTYEDNKVLVGGDGEPILLVDNPNAVNPTYAQLVAFVEQDTTDNNDYLVDPNIGYVCADFAEDVHNHAEAAGIRAASVSVEFEGSGEGHALNAFDTTDRGLVYIDCTGQSFSDKLSFHLQDTGEGFTFVSDSPQSWDAVAYIEVGKEYGLVPLAKARALYYSFYEEYKEKWQQYQALLAAFNEEVGQFNQEIKGRTYYEGSAELARIEAWQAELESQSQTLDGLSDELGNIWFEPKGIVKEIRVHWGPGD
jgi:hypothetical protein